MGSRRSWPTAPSRARVNDQTMLICQIETELGIENAEAIAMVGYAQHRLGDEPAAVETLRKALQLDPEHSEARIYLGNILYDQGEYEGALYQLDRTKPEDHWDELGIWRLLELKKDVVILLDSITRLARAYNTVQPPSGKVLSGGIDGNALQRPIQLTREPAGQGNGLLLQAASGA